MERYIKNDSNETVIRSIENILKSLPKCFKCKGEINYEKGHFMPRKYDKDIVYICYKCLNISTNHKGKPLK